MATRKRNEWLDAEESDEEEQTYESEDEGRAQTLRSKKRQKTDHSDSEEDAPSENDEDNALSGNENQNQKDEEDEENENENNLGGYSSNDAELKRLEKLRSTLPTDLKLTSGQPLPRAPKKDKSGVIYLSRVPPFMKPSVLRSLLEPYGPTNRIFLTPETATSRAARLRGGGTRRKLFLDGWVEFVHKRDAKFVAEQLNAQTMGGKKRSRWHDEVWNIKYLSGVKWSYLVEEIQNQNAERAVRLRKEIAKDKLENERFLSNLEKGKMIEGIEKKKKLKEAGGNAEEEKGAQKSEGEAKKKERRSRFEQHEMRSKFENKAEPSEKLNAVLSSIF